MNARFVAPVAVVVAGLVLAAAGRHSADPAQPGATRDRAVAVVGDKAVGWTEVAPLLAEAAGGQVLEEYALGQVLRDECARRGIRIGPQQVGAERELLVQTMARSAHVPVTEGEALLARVRRSRGLGDLRFRALLERNAALRAMVRAGVGDVEVRISAEDIDTAYELKHGPRVRARLILVGTEEVGRKAMADIRAGRPFGEVAGEYSIDPSGARGGQLDPFSLKDTTYPVAVRKTLMSMQPGNISDPLGVNWGGGLDASEQTGFAIVKLEENLGQSSGAPTRDAAAKDLEAEVRTVRERAVMDRLARKLIRETTISAMDQSLHWSWENRTRDARKD